MKGETSMFGNNCLCIIIILVLLFCCCGNGFGNGFGNNGDFDRCCN